MKNILTIMSKEFARFFGDRRMIIMTILPAVLIYSVYTLMGTTLASVFAPDEDHTPMVFAVNAPDSIIRVASAGGIEVSHSQTLDTEEMKDKILRRETDLFMVFPPDFDRLVDMFDVQTSTGVAPNIEIYFISTDPNSQDAYRRMTVILDNYESSLVNKFDINRGIENADLASAQDFAASIISTMMPMLLMTFLYSGCMGLSLESITGEKERGTLATLLVSPLKRSELAIGKILSLAVLSFLSGAITAIATILALPNLMGNNGGTLDTAIYSLVDYILLAFVILTTLLLMVAAISIISAFSKTVKEAGQAAMPLMIIVMLAGISGMFGGGAQTEAILYIIPLYSSAQSMSGIFSLEYSALNIILSCLSSLAYACLGGFILTKMFNSEKIMFSR
jgi:sodium transport system permease protein